MQTIDAFGQMWRFPFAMLAYCVEMMAETLRGIERLADESFAAATAPLRETDHKPGAARGEGAVTEGKERIMADKDLSNDMVKLVQFSIVSIQRGREHTLETGERIVSDNMTGEAFATWMIAEFIQRDPHRVPHEAKKYLRVYYSVLDQWEREDLHYEERQLDVLRGIEQAIRECCNERDHHHHVAPAAEGAVGA